MLSTSRHDAHPNGPRAAHATLFVGTGLWPLVHIRSFEAVTGPKRDAWLVRTVGLLLTAVGAGLLVGSRKGRVERGAMAAGVGASAALGAIDVVYASRGRIAKVYLLDVALEAA